MHVFSGKVCHKRKWSFVTRLTSFTWPCNRVASELHNFTKLHFFIYFNFSNRKWISPLVFVNKSLKCSLLDKIFHSAWKCYQLWCQLFTFLPTEAGIVGINLGKNKTSADPVADYVKGVQKFGEMANYLVINISSPNTPGLRSMQGREQLQQLVKAVSDSAGFSQQH